VWEELWQELHHQGDVASVRLQFREPGPTFLVSLPVGRNSPDRLERAHRRTRWEQGAKIPLALNLAPSA
jgi:hypothetical protein